MNIFLMSWWMYIIFYCKFDFTRLVSVHAAVLLISSYGAPLAQRASYLAQQSSHFWPDCAVNYDIFSYSINSFLIGSKCIPNGTHTNHCWDNLADASKCIKNSVMYMYMYIVHVQTLNEYKDQRNRSWCSVQRIIIQITICPFQL